MNPMLADGIDVPLALIAGLVVLVPLLVFEVLVEALVLTRAWRLPFDALCLFALVANCLSLLAGIPTKIVNGFLYGYLLPGDIPGYLARFPLASAIGTTIYFAVTLLVEGTYALRWCRRTQAGLRSAQIWKGVFLANCATYIVLAPLEYVAARPQQQNHNFVRDTRWTSHPTSRVLFIDRSAGYLKSVQLDGSSVQTIVPFPIADYLISTNLSACLFRGTNGNLYFWNRDENKPHLIWKTNEKFFINQAAFSPSGKHVAVASGDENFAEIVDIPTEKRTRLPVKSNSRWADHSVAWSPEEGTFFVHGFESGDLAVSIEPDGRPMLNPLQGTNPPAVLKCYGRLNRGGSWYGGGVWGPLYPHDTWGNLSVQCRSTVLDNELRIVHTDDKGESPVLTVSVRSGLLQLAAFDFRDVAFLDGGDECLFDSNGYIYLLGIKENKVGTLIRGDRFIQFTPRYEKVF